MFKEEARWLGNVIYGIDPSEIFPMLDVGSSSERYRRVDKPWVDQVLFTPAKMMGLKVVHTDIHPAQGVDLVGDLCDGEFLREVAAMRFRSVLCANVLEHVTDPQRLCKALRSIVLPRGYILVSAPYRFLYHPDPIDTGYRPAPEQLHELFPGCPCVRSAVVDCRSYFDMLLYTAKRFVRLCLPFYKPHRWRRLLHFKGWRPFSRFQASCAVFRTGFAVSSPVGAVHPLEPQSSGP